MHKQFLYTPQTYKTIRKRDFSPRPYASKSPTESSSTSNFTELFYSKARSLRKLFGINRDYKLTLHKQISITPIPLTTHKKIAKGIPAGIYISKNREEFSFDSYKNIDSSYFAYKNDLSFQENLKESRIKRDSSLVSLYTRNKNPSKSLPKIINHKSKILREDSLSGW